MVTAQKRDAARQGQFYFRKTLKKCEWMIKFVFFYVTEDIRELSRYCHPNAFSRESRRIVCFYSIARHFWVPKIVRFKIRSNAKPLVLRRVYSHEIKNKIKVEIKVSILTLEVTPLASLRSLPSIESVRQHLEILSRNGGGGGGWGWGAGLQYARLLPLISANTFAL